MLFIIALRHVGAARAGAYYSVAPFFGAVLALVLGDPLTWPLVIAGTLISLGIWLHLTERHQHQHRHVAVTHDHWHTHDDHHQHQHLAGAEAGTKRGHKHQHAHEQSTHAHAHFPDSHHCHQH